MDLHERILTAASEIEQPGGRPLITLSYAQSLDGSIAARRGERTQISGPESARLTHHLRAHHEAIIIGIGTLLVDDPRLTVRLVGGKSPTPVILDSKLRTPVNSGLVQSNPPWIVTTDEAYETKGQELSAAGAKLFNLPADSRGLIQMPALMDVLQREGIRRLMVEGGAEVLASFLYAQLVDFLVVTISPLILGGLPAFQFPGSPGSSAKSGAGPRLEKMNVEFAGEDLVVYGRPHWVIEDNR